MNISSVKIIFFTLSTLFLSSVTTASHPVRADIEINRDGLNHMRLNRVELHHLDDGKYQLRGLVRRRSTFSVPLGYFDLVVTDKQGQVVHEDAEYYWPRIVNRKFKRPSKFTFTVPESLVDTGVFRLSYHKNPLADKPKPER